MAIRFLMSGGNFIYPNPGATGIWGSSGAVSIINTAPAGRSTTYAFGQVGAGFRTLITPNLVGGPYFGVVAGYACYVPAFTNQTSVIGFYDATGVLQCDVRTTAVGTLYCTRNSTTISGISTLALPINSWCYVEFKALLSATAGTCEVRVNGGVVLTASGVNNAATVNGCAQVAFTTWSSGYHTDFYVVDNGTGTNRSYLGDINVIELFPNGAGAHSAWTPNIGPLVGTAVANASGGTTVYTYTTLGLAASALLGYNFVTSGYASGANNGTFKCTASTATTVTLNNAAGVIDTTGSIAFQCVPQSGINGTGTRPNGDVVYLADSTTNDISDFAHTPLVLTGSILGISHQSSLRKDDAGSRSVAQVCLSSTATEQGSTISLGNSYQYYPDIIELDPNTSSPPIPFSLSALNAATFGVKEIT